MEGRQRAAGDGAFRSGALRGGDSPTAAGRPGSAPGMATAVADGSHGDGGGRGGTLPGGVGTGRSVGAESGTDADVGLAADPLDVAGGQRLGGRCGARANQCGGASG